MWEEYHGCCGVEAKGSFIFRGQTVTYLNQMKYKDWSVRNGEVINVLEMLESDEDSSQMAVGYVYNHVWHNGKSIYGHTPYKEIVM